MRRRHLRNLTTTVLRCQFRMQHSSMGLILARLTCSLQEIIHPWTMSRCPRSSAEILSLPTAVESFLSRARLCQVSTYYQRGAPLYIILGRYIQLHFYDSHVASMGERLTWRLHNVDIIIREKSNSAFHVRDVLLKRILYNKPFISCWSTISNHW
jgi:hypothetical protein